MFRKWAILKSYEKKLSFFALKTFNILVEGV